VGLWAVASGEVAGMRGRELQSRPVIHPGWLQCQSRDELVTLRICLLFANLAHFERKSSSVPSQRTHKRQPSAHPGRPRKRAHSGFELGKYAHDVRLAHVRVYNFPDNADSERDVAIR